MASNIYQAPALTFELISKCSVCPPSEKLGSSDSSRLYRAVPKSVHHQLTWPPATQTTRARASNLTLPHGPVQLPMFMPVATQASLKGLTPEQLEETGCRLCLNNTYHLGLKPGQEVLDAVGGAHKFQGWNHNILTDSGG